MNTLKLNVKQENDKLLATTLHVEDVDGVKEIPIYVNFPTPERIKFLGSLLRKSKSLTESFNDLQKRIEKADESEKENLSLELADLSFEISEINKKALEIKIKNYKDLEPYIEYIITNQDYFEKFNNAVDNKFQSLLGGNEVKKKKQVRAMS